MTLRWLGASLSLCGLPVAGLSSYLLLLTVLSRKTRPPKPAQRNWRFRIVVPAHDESAGIAATVQSLSAIDYPADCFDVLVVADNCTDDTAERARASGATVIERHDRQNRGKGYALLHAFQRLPEHVEAVVVIDADTLVSANLLKAFAARLELGADAVQADYAVRNPNASWRTRLMAIAFGSFHVVRSRGRERLGASAGLRGNGMCFTTNVLRAVEHNAFSIVEDVEYGIRLGEAGYRVHYAGEAHVFGEMVSSAAAARSQRERWEDGRRSLGRTHAVRLLREAWQRSDGVLLDLALDVLVPPLSRLATVAVGGLLASAVVSTISGVGSPAVVIWTYASGALVAYVFRGWMVSGTGARGLFDLACAPVYVLWKATLLNRRKARVDGEWVRTAREQSPKD
jgi:1,2-diacylglycerol 3-beta-glucosyltransferase